MYRRSIRSRRGSIIPLLAVTIVALLGFVALSIDVGLMAMARTQAQNAADCAALTGARTLTGDPRTNNNFAACEPAARHAASVNQVMGRAVDGSNPAAMTVQVGAYSYDPVAGQFNIKLPKGTNDPYCLVRVNLAINDNPTYFGRVFNVNSFNTAAMATAAHRPRDVALIGFGPVFDSTNPELDTCLATLQTMQYRGNTQNDPATPLDSFKIVTGTDAEVIDKLQSAITTIMQGSIQIVLLE